jgi:hypothetical protein
MKKNKHYKRISDFESKENYASKVTLSSDQWQDYVGKGYNTLYNAIIPGNTMYGGAVYSGHVRQNFETANEYYPYNATPLVGIPQWNA